MLYKVIIEPTAFKALAAVSDRRVREGIRERIDGLAYDPDKQGKPLTGEPAGCRSLRAAGQRYRIIYRIERAKVIVLILAIGIRKEGDRKDIYALAKRLFRLRLI